MVAMNYRLGPYCLLSIGLFPFAVQAKERSLLTGNRLGLLFSQIILEKELASLVT